MGVNKGGMRKVYVFVNEKTSHEKFIKVGEKTDAINSYTFRTLDRPLSELLRFQQSGFEVGKDVVGSCEKISRFAEHALNDFPCQQGEGTVHRMSSRKQEREEEEEEEVVVVVGGGG